MIIKPRDAQPDTIRALERRAASNSDSVYSRACASAAARLKADVTTQHATDLIDIQLGHSEEWAVIHDLRFRVGSHAVQINHVLINTSLCFICLDTRFLDYGLEIGERGQCHAVDRMESRPVASPMNKMAKDVRMMRAIMQQENILPRRFCVTQRATVKGMVLTNPGLRLSVDVNQRKSPSVSAMASSSLFPILWKRDLRTHKILGSRLSSADLEEVAERLIDLHEPVFSDSLLGSESAVERKTREFLESTG